MYDDKYVEEFIDKVKEEREDILKSKKKFKQSYIDSKRDELLNLKKRIGEFADYKDEEYQLNLLKKDVENLKPDDIENSVDRVIKKYTQLCAITINRTNNLIVLFRSVFSDVYEFLSVKGDHWIQNLNFGSREDIEKAIRGKDRSYLGALILSIMQADTAFSSGELELVLIMIKKDFPDYFENEKKLAFENHIDDPSKWDRDYFCDLAYWFRENPALSRLPYIKKVGRYLVKHSKSTPIIPVNSGGGAN